MARVWAAGLYRLRANTITAAVAVASAVSET